MAKKRRQKIEKKEDYVFQAPELDKHEFIRKELRNAKTTFIAFGFALLMGLVSFGLRLALDDFRVGAIVGIFAIAALPFLFNTFKIDLTEFEKKSWLGVGAVYIFTWLMITIILVNPPFADIASPDISEPEIQVWNDAIVENQTVGWQVVEPNTDGEISILVNQTFRIVVKIVDNDELEKNSVRCELISPTNQAHQTTRTELGNNKYSFEYVFSGVNSEAGKYEFRVLASDGTGNDAEAFGFLILK